MKNENLPPNHPKRDKEEKNIVTLHITNDQLIKLSALKDGYGINVLSVGQVIENDIASQFFDVEIEIKDILNLFFLGQKLK